MDTYGYYRYSHYGMYRPIFIHIFHPHWSFPWHGRQAMASPKFEAGMGSSPEFRGKIPTISRSVQPPKFPEMC